MCGRFTLLADEVKILQEFGINQPIDHYQPATISHPDKCARHYS